MVNEFSVKIEEVQGRLIEVAYHKGVIMHTNEPGFLAGMPAYPRTGKGLTTLGYGDAQRLDASLHTSLKGGSAFAPGFH